MRATARDSGVDPAVGGTRQRGRGESNRIKLTILWVYRAPSRLHSSVHGTSSTAARSERLSSLGAEAAVDVVLLVGRRESGLGGRDAAVVGALSSAERHVDLLVVGVGGAVLKCVACKAPHQLQQFEKSDPKEAEKNSPVKSEYWPSGTTHCPPDRRDSNEHPVAPPAVHLVDSGYLTLQATHLESMRKMKETKDQLSAPRFEAQGATYSLGR